MAQCLDRASAFQRHEDEPSAKVLAFFEEVEDMAGDPTLADTEEAEDEHKPLAVHDLLDKLGHLFLSEEHVLDLCRDLLHKDLVGGVLEVVLGIEFNRKALVLRLFQQLEN